MVLLEDGGTCLGQKIKLNDDYKMIFGLVAIFIIQ
jgi:hypothetical protein